MHEIASKKITVQNDEQHFRQMMATVKLLIRLALSLWTKATNSQWVQIIMSYIPFYKLSSLRLCAQISAVTAPELFPTSAGLISLREMYFLIITSPYNVVEAQNFPSLTACVVRIFARCKFLSDACARKYRHLLCSTHPCCVNTAWYKLYLQIAHLTS